MKWARSKSSKIFPGDIRAAAQRGYLESVKWLVGEVSKDRRKEAKAEEGTKGDEGEEEGDGTAEERGIGEGGRRAYEGRDDLLGDSEEDEWRRVELVIGAAEGGHMDILLWAKEEKGLPSFLTNEGGYYPSGNLEVLKFLRMERYSVRSLEQVGYAIEGGHVDVLNWLVSNNSELRENISQNLGHLLLSMKTAVRKNHVDALIWVHENFGFPPDSSILYDEATSSGNFEMLKFLRNLGINFSTVAALGLAKSGNFEMIKWARDHGCPIYPYTCTAAAAAGNLEMMIWAREEGCPWSYTTCSRAVNLEILQWARDHGCPWNEDTCSFAVNLEILMWAREHGCPWNSLTCSSAAATGNLQMIKWAREHGCPWDQDTCIEAINGNHIEVLEWTFKNGCPITPETIIRVAAFAGNTEALNWAKKNLALDPSDFTPLVYEGMESFLGASCVLTWLQKNEIPFPPDFPALVESAHLPVMFWYIKNNLPAKLRGIWREIEGFLKFASGFKMHDWIVEEAGKLLWDPGRVVEFSEMLKVQLGGR
jgi:hypothetical protein